MKTRKKCRYCSKVTLKSSGVLGSYHCPKCNAHYFYDRAEISKLENIYFTFEYENSEMQLFHSFLNKSTTIDSKGRQVVDLPLLADKITPHNALDKFKTIVVFS